MEIQVIIIITYIYYSDPNKPSDEILKDVRWRPMLPNRLNYLDIGNDELVMKSRMFVDRYDKWTDLFPLPSRRGKYDIIKAAGYEVTEYVDEGDVQNI